MSGGAQYTPTKGDDLELRRLLMCALDDEWNEECGEEEDNEFYGTLDRMEEVFHDDFMADNGARGVSARDVANALRHYAILGMGIK